MSLTLWMHPMGAYCWKVMVALHDTGLTFEARQVNLGEPDERAALAALTPLGKLPALEDGGRVVAETSVIIEWLALRHPQARGLLPADAEAALEVRVWDRVLDMHVAEVSQKIVDARLFMEPAALAPVTAHAERQLDRAYAALDRRLAGREWLAGEGFSLADCAAVPALFYAAPHRPLEPHPHLAAYFERLVARPSVARVLDEARPWFRFYPLADALAPRFRG